MHAHDVSVARLLVVFCLLTSYAVVEFLGAYFSRSHALHGDAWHMIFDSANVGMLLVIALLARQMSVQAKRRFQSFGALVSSLFLVVAASVLIVTGFYRAFNPVRIDLHTSFTVAFIGLIVNGLCFFLMHKKTSLLEKAALNHLAGDTLNSVVVCASYVAIASWRQYWIDGLVAAAIGLFLNVLAGKLIVSSMRNLDRTKMEDVH